jgi:hypothetical protein
MTSSSQWDETANPLTTLKYQSTRNRKLHAGNRYGQAISFRCLLGLAPHSHCNIRRMTHPFQHR